MHKMGLGDCDKLGSIYMTTTKRSLKSTRPLTLTTVAEKTPGIAETMKLFANSAYGKTITDKEKHL